MDPALTIGIEEEYLLVDPETYDLVPDPPEDYMRECKEALGERVTPEFLKCQVEVGTPVCSNPAEARPHLIAFRRTLKRIAERHGLRLMAASTHPFAQWDQQHHTAADRYDQLDSDMGGVIRRMLICGMHVHIGIEDPELRIDLMNQATYFLPHLLALSTSSPFWGGHEMGMKSSRLTIFDGMPRTGIPDYFDSWSEYEAVVGHLIDSGILEDASKIWWDLRPSARFPTLEMRITDVCTRLEDALCVAALYQCIMRMLVRLKKANQRWRIYPRVLVKENRWLAQRHGVSGSLIDLGRRERTPDEALSEEILSVLMEDAEALGCVNEINHMRTILDRGTSADRQIRTYNKARKDGADMPEALREVAKDLVEETAADLP
jgi:carboxylate-amine ligase